MEDLMMMKRDSYGRGQGNSGEGNEVIAGQGVARSVMCICNYFSK